MNKHKICLLWLFSLHTLCSTALNECFCHHQINVCSMVSDGCYVRDNYSSGGKRNIQKNNLTFKVRTFHCLFFLHSAYEAVKAEWNGKWTPCRSFFTILEIRLFLHLSFLSLDSEWMIVFLCPSPPRKKKTLNHEIHYIYILLWYLTYGL